MSRIIKQLDGESIPFENLSMETFYSEEQINESKVKSEDIIQKAYNKAKEIKTQAEKEAEDIIIKGQQDAEQLKQHAKKQGYEEGLAQARDEVNQEFDGVIDSINSLRVTVDVNLTEIVTEIEKQIIELVMEICKRIIGYEAKANKEIIQAVIEKCLAKTKEKNHIVIKVNPHDLKYVETKKDFFYKKIRGLKHLDIEESEAVAVGGCRIETSIGDVSGDIEEQLDKIKEAYMTGA